MNVLLLTVFFLQTLSHAFGRPDYTLDDPKTRFSRSPQDDGTIIFPHEEKNPNHHHHHKYKMPKIKPNSCENDICEDVDDYPVDYIDKILGKTKEFQDYFARQSQDESFIVSDRVGGLGEYEEQTLCTSSVRTQKPKLGKNLNGTFITVVNTEKYQQVIVTETCESNNLKCKFADIFPNNYKTGCKQKYTNHRLIAFDDSGSFIDVFPIPSCCVCFFQKTGL